MSEVGAARETVHDLIAWARVELASVTDTPSLDAQLLLMRTLGVPRAWVLAHPEATLQPDQLTTFESYVRQCAEGKALPYVVGRWEFFGRPFHVSPEVLIPRPETELLVQVTLGALAQRQDFRRVLEVGTGSGCIVITLALEMEQRDYFASDIARPALEVARRNAREYRAEGQIGWVQADLLRGLRGPFDLICANLPYIPSSKLGSLKVAEREPNLALDGGEDGLEPLRASAADMRRSLRPGGEVVLELDPEQMEPAQEILAAVFPLEFARVQDDLSGRARVLHVRRVPEA